MSSSQASQNMNIGGAQVPTFIFFWNLGSKIWKGEIEKQLTGMLK